MTDHPSNELIESVRALADKARRLRDQYRDRSLGEENTKAALISPLLEALGWNIRDPEEVHHEFKPTPKDSPVDYCLKLIRSPKLLVEAKGLGENLDDRKWIRQTLSYATMAGAEWCVLTDGDEYRLYNAVAPVEADLKLLCQVRLSDTGADEAAKVLNLISRSNMSGPRLKELWQRYHADRRVRTALRAVLEEPDRKLVLLIRKQIPDLSSKEIAGSIRRLDIRIEAPDSQSEPGKSTSAKQPTRSGKGRKGSQGGTSLADLIGAGILTPPLKLFRLYKGKRLEATILADGAVEFQGQRYDTCSAAAEAARATITGRKMNTNGWVFWQYQGADGKRRTLADARKQASRKATGQQPHGAGNQPERDRLRRKFWEELLARPKMQGTRHANIAPGEYSYIAAGSGVRGLPFIYVIGQDEGRVELYIDRGSGQAAENKAIYDKLLALKADVEKAFGAGLVWQRLDDKRACRIAYTLTVGGYRSDEAEWPAIHDAMIDAMGRLEQALALHLAKLKTELTS